eukprot:TRINITY_DN1545_c0_g4_i3.p1 TRINITY_DN1545_c0_g4~~TRINITY_DN1545_c0_g4_i3.p1  ORF type:complete len:472 (-),score=134.97 TRINITY_DN1545_c0_g4_i3:94-1509(-)
MHCLVWLVALSLLLLASAAAAVDSPSSSVSSSSSNSPSSSTLSSSPIIAATSTATETESVPFAHQSEEERNAKKAINNDEEEVTLAAFGAWTQRFDKHYGMEDFLYRFSIFRDNNKRIAQHNRQMNVSYRLEATRFADLSFSEFEALHMPSYSSISTLSPSLSSLSSPLSSSPSSLHSSTPPSSNSPHIPSKRKTFVPSLSSPSSDSLSSSSSVSLSSSPSLSSSFSDNDINSAYAVVDWKAAGADTPVIDQGQCGASWAITVVNTIESWELLHHGHLLTLSPQELMDCCPLCLVVEGDGCLGGNIIDSYNYISLHGLSSLSDYPYVAYSHTGTERIAWCKKATHVFTKYGKINTIIKVNGENELLYAVNKGIVVVSIATSFAFQSYANGVLDDDDCGRYISHVVTVIGYGTDSVSGKDYWLLKNLWGETWGDHGYVKLVRGKNMCAIGRFVAYVPCLNSTHSPAECDLHA